MPSSRLASSETGREGRRLISYYLGLGPGFLPPLPFKRLSLGVAVLGWFLLLCLPRPSAIELVSLYGLGYPGEVTCNL